MTELSVPPSIDGLTPEWLSTALGTAPGDVTVTAFSVEPIGGNKGFLGELARITPTYDGASGPGSLIVKFASSNDGVRTLANFMHAYEREIMFYRNLAHDAPCRPPAPYFSGMDIEAGQFVLGLEDMADARIGDQIEGASEADAFDVVRMLARLHGHYWQSPKLDDSPWMPELTDTLDMALPILVAAQDAFREKFSDAMAGDTASMQPETVELLPKFIASYAEEARTIIHMDPRLDNIAFEAGTGAERIRLFDWQIASKGPAAYDLMYFIAGSIETDLRRKIETDLIASYHEELVAVGVTDYSHDKLMLDYRRSLASMLAVILANGEVLKDDPEHLAMGNLIVNRYTTAMLDHDTKSILASFR